MNTWNFRTTLLATAMLSAMALVNGCGGGGSSGGNSGGDNSTQPSKPVANAPTAVAIDGIEEELANNLVCNRGYGLNDRQKAICNLRIYHVMVNSFQNGDDSINYNIGYGPSDNKGDIKGIINAVHYIKGLNMNAVLTTPFMKSSEGNNNLDKLDSSGYFVNDYSQVDPHFGTDADVIKLSKTLHDSDMYFFGDIAMGHFKKAGLVKSIPGIASDLVTTSTCRKIGGTYEDNDRNGCTAFSDSTDFFVRYMEEYTAKWGLDGWRFDQGYQVPVADQKKIQDAILNTAKAQNTLGLAFAEIWSGNKEIKDYAITGGNEGVESAFSFGTRYAIVKTFATQEWAGDLDGVTKSVSTLVDEFKAEQKDFKSSNDIYPISFITNHDVVRFANLVARAEKHKQISSGNVKVRAKAALGYLASLSGPIANYYGEEIGQKFDSYPAQPTLNSEKTNYCETVNWVCDDNASRTNGKISDFTSAEQEVADYFTALMKLREEVPALPFGRTDILKSTNSLLVELKSYEDEAGKLSAIIYAVNVSENENYILELDPKNLDAAEWSDDDTLNNPITGEVFERSYAKKQVLDENGEAVLNDDGTKKMEDDTSSPFVFRVPVNSLEGVYLVKTGTISGDKL